MIIVSCIKLSYDLGECFIYGPCLYLHGFAWKNLAFFGYSLLYPMNGLVSVLNNRIREKMNFSYSSGSVLFHNDEVA